MSTIEVKVPDIGDFTDVPVIEILVKPGDTVKAEDSLVTLESDKATMDVPAPAAGVVKSLGVKVGDKVSEGALLLTLETAAAEAPPAQPAVPAPASAAAAKPQPTSQPVRQPAPAPTAAAGSADDYRGAVDIECQMVVIGAGPGGYSGAFRAADLGLKTVLIERYPKLGGVCLNVGCIPSKALLHAAKVIDEAEEMSHFGVSFGKPAIDLERLRGWKESVIGKLTGGLSGLAKQRKVSIVTGVARFVDAHHVEVSAADGKKQVVKFEHCIIAAGSQAVKLPFIPDDPRVVDSTGALELGGLPKHMLVIGGGIIGMEMAQVYSALGAKITVVEMLDQLMTGADPDLVRPFARRMEKRYEKIMLKTRV
ncbi:MAG: FAD-dependent oxidoreductase, partial [Betaproteobacteria bacterium]